MKVELFEASDERLEQAIAVRVAVFVDEQGVPMEEELDERDSNTDPTVVHAVVREVERAIAAGRMYTVKPGVARVGRMAVLAEARGRGIGRAVLDALVDEARARGFSRVVLSAQVHARQFYEKAGFVIAGREFVEASIPHIEMSRDI